MNDHTTRIILQFILMTPWLLALCHHDWRERRLPNVYTCWGAVGAVVWRLYWNGPTGVWQGFLAALCCALILLVPYLLGGGGLGDVKMSFVCGYMLSPVEILPYWFFASLIGSLLGLYLMASRQLDNRRVKHWLHCLFDWHYDCKQGALELPDKAHEPCRVPFGIGLAGGSWCCMACSAIGWDYVLGYVESMILRAIQ